MNADFQTVVALLVVAGAVIYLVRAALKTRAKPGCGSDCGCGADDFKKALKR